MDWILDIIKEYVIKNGMRTTTENIGKLQAYFIQQQYDSVGLVCGALIADSESLRILYING